MTIVSALSPISLAQFFYQSGKIVRPARLYFYRPGTEDGYTVYTEPTLGIPYEQPVLTGGSGRVPPIYIGEDPYRIRVFDSYGSLIEDIDYLPGAQAATEGGGGGGDPTAPGAVLQTGDMFFAMAGAGNPRTGCVRANGGLIGPVGFDPTAYPGQVERQNADTHALFVWLWGQDGANVLEVVPGGRGTGTAEDDWVLNKAIRLPDLRGRTIVGGDHMGRPDSGRISGIPITGHPFWAGSSGGVASATMSTSQMPSHSHVIDGNTTGVTIQPAVTGLAIQGASTGLTVGFATTGISLQTNKTNLTVNGTTTNLTIQPNSSGDSISQSTHTHLYWGVIPEREAEQGWQAVELPGAGSGDGPTIMVPVAREGERPSAFISLIATEPANANVTFNAASHGHAVSEANHSHLVSEFAHGHGVNEAAHGHLVTDPWHAHAIIEPASGTGHAHTVIEPAGGHTHTAKPIGGGAAMTTISPFSIATVYVKL